MSKETNDRIRDERDHLRAILENLMDGVFITNRDFRIEFMNQDLLYQFGDGIGKRCCEFFGLSSTNCLRCHEGMSAFGPPQRLEWTSLATGSTYDMLVSPLTNLDGTNSRLHILRDVTEQKKLEARILASSTPLKLAIIGAGAGGVELALSLQYRLEQALAPSRKVDHHLEVSLVTDDDQILSAFSDRLRRRFTRVLKSRNIKVHCNTRVQQFDNGCMSVENRDPIQSDAVIWVTTASAPDWLSTTGLKLDSEGFIAVNDRLQSCSHPQVFASGVSDP